MKQKSMLIVFEANTLSLRAAFFCSISSMRERKRWTLNSTQTFSYSSSLPSKPKISCYSYASSSVSVGRLSSSDLKLRSFGLYGAKGSQRSSRVHCNTGSGGPGFGEGDSRSVLDAFFLGKALAEALNERVESSVGEFLSRIGRLQAEQQNSTLTRQCQFNKSLIGCRRFGVAMADVLERAKRAKEKAAREAAEAQGLVSKSATENITPVTITNVGSPITAIATTSTVVTPVDQPSLSEPTPSTTQNEPGPADEDSVSDVPIDD